MEAWPDLVVLRESQTRTILREIHGGKERFFFPQANPTTLVCHNKCVDVNKNVVGLQLIV